jgi:hypothetical protein
MRNPSTDDARRTRCRPFGSLPFHVRNRATAWTTEKVTSPPHGSLPVGLLNAAVKPVKVLVHVYLPHGGFTYPRASLTSGKATKCR